MTEETTSNETTATEITAEDVGIGGFISLFIMLAMVFFLGKWIFGLVFGDSVGDAERWGQGLVIQKLNSPSSFRSIDTDLKWSGVNEDGDDAYIVKVDYEAENGFGASLRNCYYVAFFDAGESISMYSSNAFTPCNRASELGIEDEAVDIIRKRNSFN